jgi:RNA polymerase sigma-70 factor, ECF subfamily
MEWAEIYRTTYSDLVRYLHRKVWDSERAEDLAQEVFVRALQHAPEQPRSWLFRVAANLARDEARLVIRRRRHLALLRTDTEATQRAPLTPSEVVESGERSEAVRRALESLSERDQEVLLLWDAGLSYSEIAEQTGLAPGAMGTTLARARQRLVNAYQQWEGNDAARG